MFRMSSVYKIFVFLNDLLFVKAINLSINSILSIYVLRNLKKSSK